MSTYRQQLPEKGLSVERGTSSVPDDGRFHVILQGQLQFSSSSEREALNEYRRLRDSLAEPSDRPRIPEKSITEAIRKAAADNEARAFLAQSSREKRAKATRRGGPGGSGGVSG